MRTVKFFVRSFRAERALIDCMKVKGKVYKCGWKKNIMETNEKEVIADICVQLLLQHQDGINANNIVEVIHNG